MNLTIRKTQPKDWKIIQNLNHQIFKANSKYDPFFNPDWEFTHKGTKYLKEITSNSKYCCFIAEFNGKPAGYLNGKKNLFFTEQQMWPSLKTSTFFLNTNHWA